MKPNILIINPDQMRADALRHLGNTAAHTPAIDKLAQEGVSFENAFCQNPVCVPSRCSFMTGLYPHVHGHRTMGYLQQPHEENLFSDFKAAGYRTISSTRGDLMAGQYPKYHKALIDEYIKVHPRRPVLEWSAPRDKNDYSFLGGITPDSRALDLDDLIVDGAAKSILKNAKRDNPFFMFVGLMLPHPPYQIDKKYYDLIDKDNLPTRIPTITNADGKPLMEQNLRDGLHVDEDKFDEIRATYLAMCAKIDDMVNILINALKKAGVYDNTAVLFFSDHGDYTGDYGLVEKCQNCFPDCLVNVPLIIKPPKGIPVDPGVTDSLAELTDITATCAELAGIEINRPHFSRSLLHVLKDRKKAHRDFVSCEGGRLPGETQASEFENLNENDRYYPRLSIQASEDGSHGKAVMFRTDKFKYIRRLQEKDEFYLLENGESVNLIDNAEYSDKIDFAKKQMLDWFISTCDTVPKQIDSRISLDLMKNGIRAVKLPGSLIGSILGVYLKITKQTPSGFLSRLGKMFEKKK